ncbi:MAG TPA: GntR family transcriptional regulator [Terracidiphilus sp.]|jgi:GntR family transcriptional regulator|nr:GntR family transcriptional regulator [Terracidiphilus sp.]
MRLWLNRTGEVSLREQLITQVELAILCKELRPGERLPSTRELARRFGIHANTASAAYRELEQEGWLEFRHGSGVFVRATRPSAPLSPELAVDQLIGDMAAKARKMGAAESLVRARLRRWLQNQPPSRWLVIEPDPELCAIVIHEMEVALALPVVGCTPGECNAPGVLEGSMFVVLPSKAASVRKLLPAGSELTVLEVHPVAPELLARLQRYLPEHAGELIGIASRWKDFQRIARTMLVAAGLDPESLLVRDATQAGWKRGLDATAGVVCDSVTALELPAGVFPLRFTLLDEPTLAELRRSEQRVLPPA